MTALVGITTLLGLGTLAVCTAVVVVAGRRVRRVVRCPICGGDADAHQPPQNTWQRDEVQA